MTWQQAPRGDLLRAYFREVREGSVYRKRNRFLTKEVRSRIGECLAVLDWDGYTHDEDLRRALRATLMDFREAVLGPMEDRGKALVDIDGTDAPCAGVDVAGTTPPPSVLADIAWLHATIRWLILDEDGPAETMDDYISRPTLARKAHDKLDNIAKALA